MNRNHNRVVFARLKGRYAVTHTHIHTRRTRETYPVDVDHFAAQSGVVDLADGRVGVGQGRQRGGGGGSRGGLLMPQGLMCNHRFSANSRRGWWYRQLCIALLMGKTTGDQHKRYKHIVGAARQVFSFTSFRCCFCFCCCLFCCCMFFFRMTSQSIRGGAATVCIFLEVKANWRVRMLIFLLSTSNYMSHNASRKKM